ncbi:two-component sensor histidine kinase DegS [Thermoanaerobacter brockii subsp. lactiethylicus]|jgi:two-component system sensor histidine kinase DegS|uniref:Oxygen sensor histidine kinase NreB n=1 Tax=Thermoanaerobacter brockii subsp. finnii (strain ATCC 43586 / DSM 3389 / AKO-1) TaxID=509193 RepID=E8UQR6_THEBF|nr:MULTISPECIES: sensor histidine kinase [Thermoanaerobacter]ADV79389.1 Sensor DegS domain protein [Thermoanaerobacter brockii subsp. finnii Ako-1]MBZ4656083.1 Sensor DegS domain protein [Thermoanaerobacter sp.]MDI3501528.1 two-component system, NarL family, sensor histidine kinase DegS [Thermoanaerobacter sp.]HBW60009.1 histidine kinase [Thermoanaerobacter sp.]
MNANVEVTYKKRLDNIVEKTIEVIESSKEQIFDILEKAKEEARRLEAQLEELKIQVINVIKEVELCERKEKKCRLKLAFVSKQFGHLSEQAIREAYEEAKEAQIELALKRREEKELIEKRNELERKLVDNKAIIEKAEKLVSQINVALNYLNRDLKKMNTQLEQLKDKRALSVKIIEAQEEERKRIAREIHDGPAQAMANVLLKSELCEKLITKDIEQAKIELKNLKNIVQQSLKEVRKIIYDLRPSALDDLGLIPALSRYIKNFSEETGIFVDFSVLSDYKRLSPEIEITCFRVVQEALTNIKKHSKAKNASVKFEFGMRFISIIIKDDGIGFDKENIGQGYGLMGMRERIEILNGKFEISSFKNNGTQIYISIPVRGVEDDQIVGG